MLWQKTGSPVSRFFPGHRFIWNPWIHAWSGVLKKTDSPLSWFFSSHTNTHKKPDNAIPWNKNIYILLNASTLLEFQTTVWAINLYLQSKLFFYDVIYISSYMLDLTLRFSYSRDVKESLVYYSLVHFLYIL